jgi:hypothetical protein
MDLDLNDDEQAMLATLAGLLETTAPSPEARASGYNPALLGKLRDCGMLDHARLGASGRVRAMLAVQAVSKVTGLVPIGVQSFLSPVLSSDGDVGPIAIRGTASAAPVRFACCATTLVEVGPLQARSYRVDPRDSRPARSNYGYPRGYCGRDAASPLLGTWPAAFVTRRWHLGIAGEIAGAMAGALDHLVAYLSGRRQFGRELGSFQALQHRLAELAVTLEALRYMALEAAWADTDELAANAAGYAAGAARATCLEAHQLSGARGFTIQDGLHDWTLRLQALSLECGGAARHASVAAASYWRDFNVVSSASAAGVQAPRPALIAPELQAG